MVPIYFLIVQLLAVGRAFVRCLRERCFVGIVAGPLRAVLLLASILGAFVLTIRLPGGFTPAPVGLSAVVVLATVLGPLLSFATLWLLHRRAEGVPAALEERAAAPFRVWLPVALIDAAAVVISVVSWVLTRTG